MRYELPRASKLGKFTLTRELTEFGFAGDYRCWFGEPSDCAESNDPESTLAAIPRDSTDTHGTRRPYLSTLPLTVQAPMACVAVARSDLLDWAGMFLTGTGSPKVAVTLAQRGDGRGRVAARAPWVSPWRVLMIGRTAAGLKIDFMNSDSQETVQWCERVLKTAARHKLTVDFQGAYKPTGLARTYPNYITQEGVLGNEYNKIALGKCTTAHTITLAFTRGLLGPMDFTPGGYAAVLTP